MLSISATVAAFFDLPANDHSTRDLFVEKRRRFILLPCEFYLDSRQFGLHRIRPLGCLMPCFAPAPHLTYHEPKRTVSVRLSEGSLSATFGVLPFPIAGILRITTESLWIVSNF